MNVEVRLYGSLRRYRPSDTSGATLQSFVVEMPPGSTVEDLGRALGIPDGFISAAAVNNQAVDSASLLADSDRISLFPPSAGG